MKKDSTIGTTLIMQSNILLFAVLLKLFEPSQYPLSICHGLFYVDKLLVTHHTKCIFSLPPCIDLRTRISLLVSLQNFLLAFFYTHSFFIIFFMSNTYSTAVSIFKSVHPKSALLLI